MFKKKEKEIKILGVEGGFMPSRRKCSLVGEKTRDL
jgi:hypothetical protein